MSFDSTIDEIIRREGGYVNNPNDSGGPTKYGITLKVLSTWRGKSCTIKDVQDLTVVEAKAIYLKQYVKDPKFDLLPKEIRDQVIDIGVNSGVGTSSILLIRACLTVMPEPKVKETSVLTPRELGYVAQVVTAHSGQDVNNALVRERVRYMAKITVRYPKNLVFLQGWVDRAFSFLE